MRGAHVSAGRALWAGIVSGVAAAALASLLAILIGRSTGIGYPELTLIPITLASVVSNLVGALAFYALAHWRRFPVALFAVAGLCAATLDSLVVALHPPHPGFAAYATPLHYLVALIAIVLIPRIALRIPRERPAVESTES